MSALSLLRQVGPYLVALLIGLAIAWQVQAWRYQARIDRMTAQQAEAVRQSVEEAAERSRKMAVAVAYVDLQKTKELHDVQARNDDLARAVADDRRRLRIAATCPAAPARSADSAGVDPRAAPELDPAARQDYFALRSGIDRQRLQLEACQAILQGLTAAPAGR